MSRYRRRGWKTSENGSLRFNRDFTRIGVGRITLSARTKDRTEFAKRDAILTKLAENGQIEVLRAFRNRDISIEQLVAADRDGILRARELLSGIRLRMPLWDSVDATLPQMGVADGTRRRYAVSFGALRRRCEGDLGLSPSVRDLETVPWRTLHTSWGRSNADWNHLRRAVSAFLSAFLGEKHHDFRLRIMKAIPKMHEAARVPDVSVETFKRILRHIPIHVQPAVLILALSGMRVGEYLRCTPKNLQPETCVLVIPGTKTARSAASVTVPENYWQYFVAGIPAPVQYKALRHHFKRACCLAGVPEVRLHDLRHCFAQWATNAGVRAATIQAALRHVNPAQTAAYARQKESGEAIQAVGALIFERGA